MAQSKQCVSCKHYLGAHACDAFIEGIPEEIITGLHDHRQPYDGDNGLRFELSGEYQAVLNIDASENASES